MRSSIFFLSIVVLLGLGACARPIGDFGRARPDVIHDKIYPAIGALRASLNKEPVSGLNLADEELEMRDRVWRFLIAPHAGDWFFDVAVELQRTRIVDDLDGQFATTRYYDYLHNTEFRSSRTRYLKLSSDIEADSAMLPPTYAIICKVIDIDRQRGIAVSAVESATDADAEDVAARRFENERIIDWFVRAVDYRTQSYSVALQRLLFDTPHEVARETDNRQFELANLAARAKSHDFCSGNDIPMAAAPIPPRKARAIPSREFVYQK